MQRKTLATTTVNEMSRGEWANIIWRKKIRLSFLFLLVSQTGTDSYDTFSRAIESLTGNPVCWRVMRLVTEFRGEARKPLRCHFHRLPPPPPSSSLSYSLTRSSSPSCNFTRKSYVTRGDSLHSTLPCSRSCSWHHHRIPFPLSIHPPSAVPLELGLILATPPSS